MINRAYKNHDCGSSVVLLQPPSQEEQSGDTLQVVQLSSEAIPGGAATIAVAMTTKTTITIINRFPLVRNDLLPLPNKYYPEFCYWGEVFRWVSKNVGFFNPLSIQRRSPAAAAMHSLTSLPKAIGLHRTLIRNLSNTRTTLEIDEIPTCYYTLLYYSI